MKLEFEDSAIHALCDKIAELRLQQEKAIADRRRAQERCAKLETKLKEVETLLSNLSTEVEALRYEKAAMRDEFNDEVSKATIKYNRLQIFLEEQQAEYSERLATAHDEKAKTRSGSPADNIRQKESDDASDNDHALLSDKLNALRSMREVRPQSLELGNLDVDTLKELVHLEKVFPLLVDKTVKRIGEVALLKAQKKKMASNFAAERKSLLENCENKHLGLLKEVAVIQAEKENLMSDFATERRIMMSNIGELRENLGSISSHGAVDQHDDDMGSSEDRSAGGDMRMSEFVFMKRAPSYDGMEFAESKSGHEIDDEEEGVIVESNSGDLSDNDGSSICTVSVHSVDGESLDSIGQSSEHESSTNEAENSYEWVPSDINGFSVCTVSVHSVDGESLDSIGQDSRNEDSHDEHEDSYEMIPREDPNADNVRTGQSTISNTHSDASSVHSADSDGTEQDVSESNYEDYIVIASTQDEGHALGDGKNGVKGCAHGNESSTATKPLKLARLIWQTIW